MKKIILILDKEEYRNKEQEINNVFEANELDVNIIYTKYEDALIRMVCKWKYVGEILLHLLYWLKSFLYAIKIYFNYISNNTNIITINPIVGVFLGLLNRKNKYEIILCGFLFEPKRNKFYYSLRKKIVKFFLKGIKYVVVYSKKEVEYYKNIFPSAHFIFVPYGIDYDNKKLYKGELPNNYIFSGGRSNRDFKTLINAHEILSEQYKISLCIATRPVVLQDIEQKKAIILKDVVLESFGSSMEKSKFIILPLIETEISAGHQVLLEALERNMIIIVSSIDAVKDYVDENQVIFYNPNDVIDLYEKMKYVLENYEVVRNLYLENNKYYMDNYTFINFVNRLAKIGVYEVN